MQNKPNKLKLDNMMEVNPITENQNVTFSEWKRGQNLVLNGSAGTGKTFMALFLALQEVLDKSTPYDQVIVIRSVVPTRDIGFLPGDEEEKKEVYAGPYKSITSELFEDNMAWAKLVNYNTIQFMSTSFIRGVTLSNAIVVVDEMQNLNGHELDTVITRLGKDCRIILCGDYYQSDFNKKHEKDGIIKFLQICEQLNKFSTVEFSWKDIVRSGLVRDYIMTKEMLNITL